VARHLNDACIGSRSLDKPTVKIVERHFVGEVRVMTNAGPRARRETTEGSLERGKVADLVILSRNVFESPPTEIAQTTATLTMVGGRIVHRSL
jgi:cytosine/adenosine deaminase-related metal-dependent hydrolase